MIEIINKRPKPALKAVIFDFDGTISVLRAGWEKVMEPLMLEVITDGQEPPKELIDEVRAYIDESTGIQTALQMEWLVGRIKSYGAASEVHDLWWYKDEYNRRLIENVKQRLEKLNSGELSPDDYIVGGSVKLLDALKNAGIDLYVASGTDNDDVINEVKALGLFNYFKGIAGAPYRKKDCTKEAIIRQLMEEKKLSGDHVMVAGDGKVEIQLGHEAGALTLGAATDEDKRFGVNPVKRERLLKAGADAIVGDFSDIGELKEYLNI